MRAEQRRDWWPDPPKECPLPGAELVPMSLDHLDEVMVIENQSFPTPWHRQAFEYDLTENHLARYWVVLVDGMVAGYAGLWLVNRIGHITTLCVRPALRGKGLGRWLLLEVMRRGNEMGAERFTLEVRESNSIARNLYTSVGFKVAGRREQYYREIGEDALIMWTGDPPYEA